ncbi:hypothetical protein ACF0H5_015320 [Mactra antiquata]
MQRSSDEEAASDERRNRIEPLHRTNWQDVLPNYPTASPPDKIIVSKKEEDNTAVDLDDIYISSDDADRLSLEGDSEPEKEICMISFKEIDEHARQGALANIGVSFNAFTTYLSKNLASDHRLILLARAIVVWMNEDVTLNVQPSHDTPDGLKKSLQTGELCHATCYKWLCRGANLQCVRISGYTKGKQYDPGNDKLAYGFWNAVFTEYGWQIVHPKWICGALRGHRAKEWVQIEKDGERVESRVHRSQGHLVKTFRQRYFMPDPKVFLHECCALDTKWQLVEMKDMILNQRQFVSMPYLLPHFFIAGLNLTSEQNCKVNSVNGICKIEIKGKTWNADKFAFKYELFLYEGSCDAPMPSDSRMVCNFRAREMFTFEVRFPVTGTYKLVIRGGPSNSFKNHLMSTLIVCDSAMSGGNLFPISCPETGYGPGPACRKAGLITPSKIGGRIDVPKQDMTSSISFRMVDIAKQFIAECHGEVGGRVKTIKDSVKMNKVVATKMLIIIITVPSEGEFGLAINEVEYKNNERKEQNICNYLLSTYTYEEEKANVKLAKKSLKDALSLEASPERLPMKIASIKTCIKKCHDEKIPSTDEELIFALNELKLLIHRNSLRECLMTKDPLEIREKLKLVLKYENRLLLEEEIDQVLRLQKKVDKGLE